MPNTQPAAPLYIVELYLASGVYTFSTRDVEINE
jgi:hypothetical protein